MQNVQDDNVGWHKTEPESACYTKVQGHDQYFKHSNLNILLHIPKKWNNIWNPSSDDILWTRVK